MIYVTGWKLLINIFPHQKGENVIRNSGEKCVYLYTWNPLMTLVLIAKGLVLRGVTFKK